MFFTKNKDKDFEIEIFKSEELGEIRTIEKNDKVLFCATDIARSLGYSNPHDAQGGHETRGRPRTTINMELLLSN